MSYEEIDRYIHNWASFHGLKLFTRRNERPARFAYVSSEAGECFQISIEEPIDGWVKIFASCVEGRRDLHPAEDWRYPTAQMTEEVFQTVTVWMQPAQRYWPD
jgi:hypothetical protein